MPNVQTHAHEGRSIDACNGDRVLLSFVVPRAMNERLFIDKYYLIFM